MVTVEQVRACLQPVKDPEIGLSIVDLGLVRGIEVDPEKGSVTVKMTLTSPMCPLGPEIVEAARFAVSRLEGVSSADVELVWSPPWDPRIDADDEVKAMLGIWD
ncbi:MAG: metal-sulfur cluster assembly factor [Acidobacteria bacterium]|nr:metal-sulfur cluster assembly factor [Acidobacteriota bacterium]